MGNISVKMFYKILISLAALVCLSEGKRIHYDLSVAPLIVGGVEAVPYEFPWSISLQRASHSCGGSIVNNEWIVTAG